MSEETGPVTGATASAVVRPGPRTNGALGKNAKMSGMRDSHRQFLQTMMSHGILASKDIKRYHQLACQRYNENYDEADLVQFVRTINVNIKPLHLEIQKTIQEDNAAHFYCMVNTADTAITKLASDFTPSELELFNKLLELIVESDSGTVSSIEAINLADSVKNKMTKQDAQALLNHMEEDHWLIKTSSGQLALSARTIAELAHYIEERFPDFVTKCNMCKKLCLQGQCCDQCDVKMHIACAWRYFRDSDNQKCPEKNCQAPWSHPRPQLEKSGESRRTSTPAPSTSSTASSGTNTREMRKRKIQT